MLYKLIINSIDRVWSSQQILISSVFMFGLEREIFEIIPFRQFLDGRRFVSIAKCCSTARIITLIWSLFLSLRKSVVLDQMILCMDVWIECINSPIERRTNKPRIKVCIEEELDWTAREYEKKVEKKNKKGKTKQRRRRRWKRMQDIEKTFDKHMWFAQLYLNFEIVEKSEKQIAIACAQRERERKGERGREWRRPRRWWRKWTRRRRRRNKEHHKQANKKLATSKRTMRNDLKRLMKKSTTVGIELWECGEFKLRT